MNERYEVKARASLKGLEEIVSFVECCWFVGDKKKQNYSVVIPLKYTNVCIRGAV